MDFTKMNKVVATFKNAKQGLSFRKWQDVKLGEVYKVNGVFSVNGKYGLRYFVSLEKDGESFNFDLPTGQNENARLLTQDKASVNSINNGECGIIINTYFSKRFNKDCVNVEWTNIDIF